MSHFPKKTIKALVCEKLGNPASADCEILGIKHLPPPILPPNCVRIKVIAAALNFADALQIQGTYQEKPKLPFTPGSEASGIVTEVGGDVRGSGALKVGDTVCAVTQGGAFAEEVVAPAVACVKLPASCDVEAAAGLPVAFGTAYMALERARLQPNQTILILGAAGGVGLAAVQLSKIFGATVVAVARGPSKMSALRDAGADICLDLSTPGFSVDQLPQWIKKNVPGGGVDVLFDPVGGPLSNAAFKALKWGGHMLLVGFASGKPPHIPANIALVKNISVHGIYWGAHMQRDPAAFRTSLEAVAGLYSNGDIFVHVSHRYSLEQAKEAFSVLTKREIIGKLLLLPSARSML